MALEKNHDLKKIKPPKLKTKADYLRGVSITPQASMLYSEASRSPNDESVRINSPIEKLLNHNFKLQIDRTRSQSHMKTPKKIDYVRKTLLHSRSHKDTNTSLIKDTSTCITEKSIMDYAKILSRPVKTKSDRIKLKPISGTQSRFHIKTGPKLTKSRNGYTYTDNL